MYDLNIHHLESTLHLLAARLESNGAVTQKLVVCGGAALIATGLLPRSTTDVDVVALVSEEDELISPAPLPESLIRSAREVAAITSLPENWLNNDPSRNRGGLFQMGLPEGLQQRLHKREYGPCLTVFFIDRFDQIHFKLYAAVDRGGYHINDLEALNPSDEELFRAAQWARTHDISQAFAELLKILLKDMGHENVAARL